MHFWNQKKNSCDMEQLDFKIYKFKLMNFLEDSDLLFSTIAGCVSHIALGSSFIIVINKFT
jgi:hypothetical protein